MTSEPKTILVVDDELEINHAVKAILEDEGFRVLTAYDGAEALAVLAEHRPDLVLMDIMMPKLSGYEVLKRIREGGALEGAPVILMSCVTPQLKRSEFQWQHFLKKPFTIDELLDAVSRAGRESSR